MRSILLFTVLSFALPAHADLTLTYADGADKPSITMSIKGSQMRMDVHGDQAALLFDGGKREITVLHEAERSYMVFDRATLRSLKQQMEQAMQMMERMGMDPSQMGMSQRSVPEEVATGRSREVNGWDCDEYRLEVDGKVESVACVASAAELGVSAGDYATMQSMFEMLADMAAEMMPAGLGAGETAPVDGILVESDGSGEVQRLTRVSDAALDAATFQVPSGWKRQSMEMPGMPGG